MIVESGWAGLSNPGQSINVMAKVWVWPVAASSVRVTL